MINFLLRRPIAVFMAFTACFIVGMVTYNTLPVSLLPDIAIPEITVQVTGENTSASELENTVYVQPFVNSTAETLVGTVSEVNPVVESNGMVKVKAQVKNNGTLLQGMNVNVLLRQPMEQALVIPKSAVVMRSGKPVVFTRVNGKAQWNYVQITAENSDSCVVAPRSKEYEGLSIGDSVIVSGNLNLAHETDLD